MDYFNEDAGKQTGSKKKKISPLKKWWKIYQVYPVSLTVIFSSFKNTVKPR